ncbi:MAG: serine/threonine protein kinase [Opitutaceae bacterium]|nr:serine/threonine protein kinase [Opitutaceae bacterium]
MTPGPGHAKPRCPRCGKEVATIVAEDYCVACLFDAIDSASGPGGEPAPATGMGAGASPATTLLPVPGYTVDAELARGGMGIVYRARQWAPEREVALKMLLPSSAASPDLRERFQLEARTLSELDHPAILPVYETGVHDGLPWFTMKLATGGNLAEAAPRFRGRWHEIAELIATVAEAVHFAHGRGILHRDLKPGNILFDAVGRPFVADFGLAKLIRADGDFTRTALALGTPSYLAPEVAARSAREATIASDVYGLGAMLFELLAGRPPFEAEGLPALLRKIAEDELASVGPANGQPGSRAARVPRDLEVITLKCLAKNPAHRYGSAHELAAELRRWLRGEPVLARPPSASYRIGMFVRRRPLVVGLAAGLAFALLAGTVISLTLMFRARESQADLAAFAAFLTEDVLAAARPREVEGGQGINITVRDALVAADEKLPDRFVGRARAEALTRHTLGVTFYNLGETARGIAQLERARELQRKTLGERDPRTLHTMTRLGQLYLNAGRSKDAIAVTDEALAGQLAVLGPDHQQTIETMTNLGLLFSRSETLDLPRAVAIGEQALERAQRTLGPKARLTWLCMLHLGLAYTQTGRFSEAVALHEFVLAQLRAVDPAPNGYTLRVMNDLGFAYVGARQFDQAIQLHREAMELSKTQLGEEHPQRLMFMNNLAADYLAKEDFAAAEATARACVELRTKTLGAGHFDTLGTKMTLAHSLLAQGRHAAAEPLVREVLAALEQVAPDDLRTHATRLTHAEALLGLQRNKEADALAEAAIARLEPIRARVPIASVPLDQRLARIARLHAAQGDAERAARWEERRREWAEWDEARRRELAAAGRGAAIGPSGAGRP